VFHIVRRVSLLKLLDLPEDAEKLAEMMGTKNTLEYTAQVSQIGSTHMGTVWRTCGFISHPDEIKALQIGEAFFYSKETGKVTKMKAKRSIQSNVLYAS